jgi:P27 family predicted phage terminase small subunit
MRGDIDLVRGRTPKPTKLKVLQGNPGKRALNKREPEPNAAENLKCPSWINKYGCREWNRIIPELKRLGLLTKIDVGALEMSCDAYGKWVELSIWLKKNSNTFTLTDNNGNIRCIQQVPQVSMAKQACDSYRKFCTEFGLTPASRSRIQLETKEDETDKKHERFFA